MSQGDGAARRILLIGVAAGIGLTMLSSAVAAPPGAYRSIGASDEAVRDAALFAVNEEARRSGHALALKAITAAERQIVAGTNYRLVLVVAKGEEMATADAIVFRALDSHYELKQWRWLNK